ncbi:hypothetical protein VTJ04DRAFT_5340 [Mycothermus thermophilus]|uniref:uncharacterized protein n=1 Tax=Humicola insolens TaxID=85995 RepID=UPI00374210C2
MDAVLEQWKSRWSRDVCQEVPRLALRVATRKTRSQLGKLRLLFFPNTTLLSSRTPLREPRSLISWSIAVIPVPPETRLLHRLRRRHLSTQFRSQYVFNRNWEPLNFLPIPKKRSPTSQAHL